MLTHIFLVLNVLFGFATAKNAFFIGARRHKPRWYGHHLTIAGSYEPYQAHQFSELTPYNYAYRPYFYENYKIEDDSSGPYDRNGHPDINSFRGILSENHLAKTPPRIVEHLPLSDNQETLMRRIFIDFLIRQGPNLYKDHMKMKFMSRATNSYLKSLGENYNRSNMIFKEPNSRNYQLSNLRDRNDNERDRNNRTYIYGIPKYSEPEEPTKTKSRGFTTLDLKKDSSLDMKKNINNVNAKDGKDVGVKDVGLKEVDGERKEVEDIKSIQAQELVSPSTNLAEQDYEYSPSTLGKSIKDLVSKDNIDQNVNINEKPLWKQKDKSWISNLYKRGPSKLLATCLVPPSTELSKKIKGSLPSDKDCAKSSARTDKMSADKNNLFNKAMITASPAFSSKEGSVPRKKIQHTSSSIDAARNDFYKKIYKRDVFETIKKILNEEDKFQQSHSFSISENKISALESTEDEITMELGALRSS